MEDIQEMFEELRKHRDLKQEFEMEWRGIFSEIEDAKDKFQEAIAPAREIEQQLSSLTPLFSKELKTQGSSPDPEKIVAPHVKHFD